MVTRSPANTGRASTLPSSDSKQGSQLKVELRFLCLWKGDLEDRRVPERRVCVWAVSPSVGTHGWLPGCPRSPQEQPDCVPDSRCVRCGAASHPKGWWVLGVSPAAQGAAWSCPSPASLLGVCSLKPSSRAPTARWSPAKLGHVSRKPEIRLECPELIYAFIYMGGKKKKKMQFD